MNICYTALVLLLTYSALGMEKTPQEIMLSSWPSHKDALSYLAMEDELQKHLMHLGDTNLKLQCQKKIFEKLLSLQQDQQLSPYVSNDTSVHFLSGALECMEVLETQLVTLGAEYLKDSEREHATTADCLRNKFYLIALMEKNLPIIVRNLSELELKITNFFCDESLPHMELIINPDVFDVSIEDDISSIKKMSAQYAIPAIKKIYHEKRKWNETGIKAQEYLLAYLLGCDYYLLPHQRLPEHDRIAPIIKKYSDYKTNIENYLEKLKKVSREKQDDYCHSLRESNKALSKSIHNETIKSKVNDIRIFIDGVSIVSTTLDDHPFIRDDFKALLKETKRLHQDCLTELDDPHFSDRQKLPLCKIEITPIEKSGLAEILKKNTVWGWRKLPKNCELGFADKAGNFVKDERIPYSSTLYFIADVSKKIKAAHAQKANSKKSLLSSKGILFEGIDGQPDYAPLSEDDGSPTQILYSHGGSYYIHQRTNEYAYVIDQIFALTTIMPLPNADPASGKIQNPTRDEK